MGRNRVPNRLHLAAGDPSKFGKKKLAELVRAEPKPDTGLPSCPSHLRGFSKTMWDFLVPQIEIMQLDKRPDAGALEGCCRAYGRAVEADIVVQREGMTVERRTLDQKTGELVVVDIKVHPLVNVSLKSWQLYHRFCLEFGCTPVSRTRLANIDKDRQRAETDLAEILSAPREPRRTA